MSISTSPGTDLREGSVTSPQVQLKAEFSKGKRESFLLQKLLLCHSMIPISVSFSDPVGNPLRSETIDCQLEL